MSNDAAYDVVVEAIVVMYPSLGDPRTWLHPLVEYSDSEDDDEDNDEDNDDVAADAGRTC